MSVNSFVDKLNNFTSNNVNNNKRKLTSELLWKLSFDNELLLSYLTANSKKALVATSNQVFYIDALQGKIENKIDLSFVPISIAIDDNINEIFIFGKNDILKVGTNGQIRWHKKIQTPIVNGTVLKLIKHFIICYFGNKFVVADYNAVPKYKFPIDSNGELSSIYAPDASTHLALTTKAGDVFFLQANGNMIWQFCIDDVLTSVSVSDDGKIILVGSLGNKILCLHYEQKVLFNYMLKSSIVSTDISEDGNYFGVCCSDGYIYVLDVNGNTIFYEKPSDNIKKIFLTENANQILAMSNKNLIMYKVVERKTVEEQSNELESFIEIDNNIDFKNFHTKQQDNVKNNIENFIEL